MKPSIERPDHDNHIHRYVRIDGQRIHCVTAGHGQPVLLIPGWPQTWFAWRHVMQALAEKASWRLPSTRLAPAIRTAR